MGMTGYLSVMGNSTNETELCAVHDPVDFTRFVLVFGCGSSIAVVGAVTNIILGIRLVFPRVFRASASTSAKFPTLYLATLSVLDASICICYVLIMGMDALGLWMGWEWLYLAWTYYGIPVFTISRIVQLSSSWLIVAATLERLGLILTEKRGRNSTLGRWCRSFATHKGRSITISCILITAFGFRCLTLVELEIIKFPRCPAKFGKFGAIAIQQVLSSMEGVYYIFDFYIINLIQVVLPTSILLCLNIAIIRSLKRRFDAHEDHRKSLPGRIQEVYRDKFFRPARTQSPTVEDEIPLSGIRRILQEAEAAKGPQSPQPTVSPQTAEAEEGEMAPLVLGVAATAVYLHRMANQRERAVDRRSVSSATYTFIWIAASYSACNSLSLLVSFLERLPGKPLLLEFSREYQMEVPNHFYVVTTDIISFLFMFCTFLRPIIYVKFNTHIRIDWGRHFGKTLT